MDDIPNGIQEGDLDLLGLVRALSITSRDPDGGELAMTSIFYIMNSRIVPLQDLNQ